MSKILFLTYKWIPPHFSGELLLSKERFCSLVKHGHDVTVLTSGMAGFDSNENDQGVKIIRSSQWQKGKIGKLFHRLAFSTRALFYMTRHTPDIVHLGSSPFSNLPLPFLLGYLWLLIPRFLGSKIITVHSTISIGEDVLELKGHNTLWKKHWFQAMDRIICISPAIMDAVKTIFPRQAHYVMNRINTHIFYPRTRAFRSRVLVDLSIPDDAIVFVTMGSVSFRKGTDMLIEMMNRSRECHPDWRLLVIGPCSRCENRNISEKEYNELRDMAAGNQNIILMGRIDDRDRICEILTVSDIFLFPSRFEAFGLAPGEAMACGLPAIIHRLKGMTDVIGIDGQTGFYFENRSVSELTEYCRTLAEDKSLRDEMALNAIDRVQDEFSWESHISDWHKLYTELGNGERREVCSM